MSDKPDPFSMLNMALQANRVTFKDKLEQALGVYKYFYYKYIEHFNLIPKDLNDMIDGIVYMDLQALEIKNHTPKPKRSK